MILPYSNILDMIGNTPMLRLSKLDTGPCELFLKLENQNPGGSIKDRIGLSMIKAAEESGALKPGGTLIEATAGNTGLGLALVAAQKKYHLILVIPDKMSLGKIQHLKSMGAEIIMTRSDVEKGHPDYYQDIAERLAEEIPNSFYINQFANPANPLAHETTTAPEIWEQMEHKIDYIVVGVGSGGTITGLGRYFAKHAPNVEMILADPDGSVLAHAARTGEISDDVGSWLVEGIGEDFIPPNCDLDLVSDAITITDKEAFETARNLLKYEGVLAGSSTGTLLCAALKLCQRQSTPKRVVTLACDTGNKYLSKAYNDAWLMDNTLIERTTHDDLRALITHRADKHDIFSVKPDDTLLTAFTRMRMYEVSQLPILDANEHILGIISESDIIIAVYDEPKHFSNFVEQHMETHLETVAPQTSLDDLLPFFKEGKVVIVKEGEIFFGLITKVDFINHLRTRGH